ENATPNYLIGVPFKMFEQDDSIPIELFSLKTYLTPYSDYIEGKQRTYTRILTGTNEEGGNENIFLGFVGNSQQIEFKPNKDTKFHFPYDAEQVLVSDTSLIKQGATAGKTPNESDCISKILFGYDNHHLGKTQNTD